MSLILSILFSFSLSAKHKCEQKEKPLVDNIVKMMKDVSEGKKINGKTVETVDDFLGALPDEMKLNYLLLGNSESIQKSKHDEPRVVLKSPDSNIFISFNTDPTMNGNDRIEVVLFNGEKPGFEFRELAFPKDSTDPELQAKDKPQYHANPTKCFACHGNPPRPNWDTYNFWAQGLTPFNKDTLVKGCKEADNYFEIASKIEAGAPRLRHLKLRDSVEGMKASLNSSGRYRLRDLTKNGSSDDGEGVGVNTFDELTALNLCRISSQITDHPEYDKIKYAFAGAVRCNQNPETFLPPEFRKQAEDYFKDMGIEKGSSESLYDTVKSDTDKRQKGYFQIKQDKQKDYFASYMSGEDAEKEIQCSDQKQSIENRETSLNQVSRLRYMIEPMGIDMKQWSMSIDPSSYTFADLFGGISRYGAFKRVQDEYNETGGGQSFCKWLQKKSNETLDGDIKNLAKALGCDCLDFVATDQDFENLSVDILEKQAARILHKHKCFECHVNGLDEDAPPMPFPTSPTDTEGFAGIAPFYGDSIVGRLTLPAGDHRRMPKSRAPLEPIEIEAMKAYMSKIETY